MESNQTNHFEILKQLIRNWFTAILQVLETSAAWTSGDVETNFGLILAESSREISPNLWISVISSNVRIQELKEELRIYNERILNHDESLRDMEIALLALAPNYSRQSDPRFMAEVKEKLEEFLRKFLEVEREIALNDQHN